MAVLKVIQELLSTPSILVGLMALIGLCLQKKPVEDVVKGTIKTIVGFLVLSAGSSFLQTGSLNDFGTLFNFAFNVQVLYQTTKQSLHQVLLSMPDQQHLLCASVC